MARRLPETPISGVVVANEVLDALPVARFAIESGEPKASASSRAATVRLGRRARRAGADGGRARDRAALSERCRTAIAPRCASSCPHGYAHSGALLERGSCCSSTMGSCARDYYHEQRADGTLVCHYRHRAHDDPFVYPGLQDITAWVDFSACAEALGGRFRGRRLHDARPIPVERARGAAARARRRPEVTARAERDEDADPARRDGRALQGAVVRKGVDGPACRQGLSLPAVRDRAGSQNRRRRC